MQKEAVMNWKVKAFIQNFTAKFLSGLSYQIHFITQRYFRELKKLFKPLWHFLQGTAVLKKIQKHGGEIIGKIFFEAGIGNMPLLPAAYWLCGAGKMVTVDLNPYIRKELIEDTLFL
jgi:hypothetical protein